MNGRIARVLGLTVCAGLLSGCVDQRFVISSDPPGALVLRNNQPIGAAPVDDHFVYYGNYHFTLIKDGFATLEVDQKVPTPWYEYFPLDFISENLIPWKIRDVRRFTYHLEPLRQVNTDEMLGRGQLLRSRGQGIGQPAAPPPPPAPGAPPASP